MKCVNDETHWKTGYIGAGLTKMGLYVRVVVRSSVGVSNI
jgi:hypothetical protein